VSVLGLSDGGPLGTPGGWVSRRLAGEGYSARGLLGRDTAIVDMVMGGAGTRVGGLGSVKCVGASVARSADGSDVSRDRVHARGGVGVTRG
jgi:hypothetical protein